MNCGASINYLKSAILNFLDLDLKPAEVAAFKEAAKKLAKLDFEALFEKEYQGKDLIEFLNFNLGSIFSNSIGTETNFLKLGETLNWNWVKENLERILKEAELKKEEIKLEKSEYNTWLNYLFFRKLDITIRDKETKSKIFRNNIAIREFGIIKKTILTKSGRLAETNIAMKKIRSNKKVVIHRENKILKKVFFNFVKKTKETYKRTTVELYVTYEKDNLAVILLSELRF